MPQDILSIYQQLQNTDRDQNSIHDCTQTTSFSRKSKRLLQQQHNQLKREHYLLTREIQETEVFRKLKPGKEKSFRLKVLEDNIGFIIKNNFNKNRAYDMKLNEFALFTE